METDSGHRQAIEQNLIRKANLKQQVYDNTFNTFLNLKEILHEMCSEIDDELEEELDKKVRIEYRDRGKFEAQIQMADDLVLFNMHTDIFHFNREHPVWDNAYVRDNRDNSYCGIINIYNFLSDSFKYSRNEDTGYLIGRIFINRELRYFAEGKRQTSLRHEDFGSKVIDRGAIVSILETAIEYALGFDLLVPPYDNVKTVTVDQFNTKFENSKMRTGKRIGYEFSTDDI